MTAAPDILCIGSVLWDLIGRAPVAMRQGSDVPGRITRVPGGVAMNIAMALARFDVTPALLTAIGDDDDGRALCAAAQRRRIVTDHIYVSPDLPTDRYIAVEGANGLIAAIADAHSLETAGDKILSSLVDGRLGSAATPYGGKIALDGNLTEELLARIAGSPLFAAADLRLAPASPGKAERLMPLLRHPRATIYVNLEEAGLLCHRPFDDAPSAASALIARGARRVLVTDGGAASALGQQGADVITAAPRKVMVTRVTGAGDTFMAAHIAAEIRGMTVARALDFALDAAATYVSGELPL